MESIARGRESRQAVPDPERGVVVAIDISKGRLDYGCYGWGRASRVPRLRQDEAGFVALEGVLREQQEQGKEVWVALEPTGPYGLCLQEWLQDRGWKVVLVNPYHVKRTREVSDSSPGSSDAKSPRVIADLIWRGRYYLARMLEGPYGELRAASGEWQALSKDRTRLRNQAQALLELWFPEVRTVFRDPLAKSLRGVIRSYGSVGEIRHRGRARLRRVVAKATGHRGQHRAEAIWAAAERSVALRSGQEARQRHLVGVLERLEVVERRQEEVKGEMAVLLAQCPEASCLLSVPGVKVLTAARLLGECGCFADFPTEGRLEKFVGLNLVAVSSGKVQGQAHLSKRGRAGARAALCQAVVGMVRRGRLYHAESQRLRAAGAKWPEIRVALARQLLALLYALARDQQPFDRQRYGGDAGDLAGVRTADGHRFIYGAPPQAA